MNLEICVCNNKVLDERDSMNRYFKREDHKKEKSKPKKPSFKNL